MIFDIVKEDLAAEHQKEAAALPVKYADDVTRAMATHNEYGAQTVSDLMMNHDKELLLCLQSLS